MRKIFSRGLMVCAILSVAAFGADNSIGTWKIDLAKSKYTPAPMPLKSYTLVREAAPGGVKVTITGERADGTPIDASYTVKFDGSAATVAGTGTPYDTMAVKQVDANTFTYVATKTGGKYHANGRLEVSKDGKTLTLMAKGTDGEGKPMVLTLVTEKQ